MYTPFVIFLTEDAGKSSEIELNQKGPGEAFFVFCDVTKETDIKVCNAVYLH